ncbi:transcriptional regulator [Hahella sp. CCB-MM4]|uniref:metalloregulator ArsR/SmtB family transcription factor n=1 Tax=Hahella sp. (strain CCB-MM4) TaxID=1926491 RepID=UPI000B9B1990|nr:metalloregulator ArsR/SmtB family transcription factor [Hahella sp. CCB-MM4]OZG73746.1 transcriptional regulator [Hahella sp. CCB-MM4]
MNPVDLFKTLADDTRLKTICLIVLRGELCVCDLVSALSLSQPKISRHLAQLKATGVLLDRKQKQWVYYRLNPDIPAWFDQVLKLTVAGNEALISDARRNLSGNSCCDEETAETLTGIAPNTCQA